MWVRKQNTFCWQLCSKQRAFARQIKSIAFVYRMKGEIESEEKLTKKGKLLFSNMKCLDSQTLVDKQDLHI